MIATRLECPIYPVAEHMLQLGAEQVYPALQDEEFKKELQDHLASEHLLVPALAEQNEYDKAVVAKARKEQKDRRARIEAALQLVHTFELQGVSPERIKTELKRLEIEAREQQGTTVP